MTHYYYFVVIGLLYMAYPDGCQHKLHSCRALPREGASALVTHDTCMQQLHVLSPDKQCLSTLIPNWQFV